MKKRNSKERFSIRRRRIVGWGGGILPALSVYILFAVYLFYPVLKKSAADSFIFIFSAAFASIGVFLLSRRWIADFLGSFFAGALYGFGPFMISLVRFHPSASLLVSAVPWLFLPATFGPASTSRRWHLFRILTSAIPFLAIIIFVQLASRYSATGGFAVPIGVAIKPADITSFIWPLATAQSVFVNTSTDKCAYGENPVGLYHIANALLFTGLVMMIKARRYKVMAVLAAGAILAFCPPVLQVSPIVWFSIPSVGLAILAGVGLNGLVLAGFSDRKWVLAAAFLSALFSITAFIFAAGFQNASLPSEIKALFAFSGRFHLLAVLILLVIFFMLRRKAWPSPHSQIRLTLVRRLLISTALIIDLCFAAPYIANCMM